MKQQFQEWLKEICRWNRDDLFLHWKGENSSPGEYLGMVNIYTHNHKYRINAKLHKDGHTYLGCTVSARMPRAGEDWTRRNDLPDGKFTRETWDKIKNAIVRYELVKIIKPVRETIDKTPETGPSK